MTSITEMFTTSFATKPLIPAISLIFRGARRRLLQGKLWDRPLEAKPLFIDDRISAARSAVRSPFLAFYNTKKDKTFFLFLREEFRLEKTPTDYNQAVPGLKERGLILSPQGIRAETCKRILALELFTGTLISATFAR